MRCLVISADPRLLRELEELADDGVSYVSALDAAGALRACAQTQVDHAVIDGALSALEATAFLRWWEAAQSGRGFGLTVAGGRERPASQSIERVPRRVGRIAAALREQSRPWLDPDRHEYGDSAGRVRLTPSELATLLCLTRHPGTLTAPALLRCALGYEDADSLPVLRAHIANVRRKCRRAGLPDPVVTVPRVGYRAIALALREDSASGGIGAGRRLRHTGERGSS